METVLRRFFGLARLGYTDRKGMPYPLQLALSAREFSDIIVFRSPPLVVQRALFGVPRTDCSLAWLSGNVPAAFTHRAGPSDVEATVGTHKETLPVAPML